jgi:hypothetical protein
LILYALWFGSGAVCGGLCVESIRRTVARLGPGCDGAAAVRIAPGRMFRWAAAAALLLAAVSADWACGLAAAAGYLVAGRLLLAREIGRP